jgi:FMN reductase
MSGLIKNALDFSEDMRADANVYFDGKAVGCIAVAAGSQALGSTVATMRSIAHALRGWPTPYAAMINSTERPFDIDGEPMIPAVREALNTVAQQVVEFAQMRRAWRAV